MLTKHIYSIFDAGECQTASCSETKGSSWICRMSVSVRVFVLGRSRLDLAVGQVLFNLLKPAGY